MGCHGVEVIADPARQGWLDVPGRYLAGAAVPGRAGRAVLDPLAEIG